MDPSWFINNIKKVGRFFQEDLWLIETQSLPWYKQFIVYTLKLGWIIGRGFIEDECSVQALALTTSTLLSIVPVLIIMLTTAQLIGIDVRLIHYLKETTQQIPEHVQTYLYHILEITQQSNLFTMGIIVLLVFIWVYIGIMNHVETVFNKIWGIRTSRPWGKKIALYFFLMVLVCLILVTSTSLLAIIKAQQHVEIFRLIFGTFLTQSFFELSSLIGIVVGLTIFYKYMPNTQVQLSASSISALVIGGGWAIWQKICINFQIGISNYNVLYGALATFPIILFWIYVNWIMILLGAEISFALQHLNTYGLEITSHYVSQALKRRLAFRIVYEVARAFRMNPAHPWNQKTFLKVSKVPIRLLNEVLETLTKAKIIQRLETPEDWVPGRDLSTISLRDIEEALRGPVTGPFQHIGKVPIVIARILQHHENIYFSDLQNHTFDKLLQQQELVGSDEYLTF